MRVGDKFLLKKDILFRKRHCLENRQHCRGKRGGREIRTPFY